MGQYKFPSITRGFGLGRKCAVCSLLRSWPARSLLRVLYALFYVTSQPRKRNDFFRNNAPPCNFFFGELRDRA